MTTITIRDVPEPVRDTLAARAALAGQSLQEYMRGQVMQMASRPTSEEVMRRAEIRKAATGSRLSSRMILEDRDADR